MDTNRTPKVEEAMKNMSRALYAGMCLKIGTAQQIGFRREIADTDELLTNQADRSTAMKKVESGSHKEGFRLDESDIDFMILLTEHRVVWHSSQFHFSDMLDLALILCDSSGSPPGYTLLRLPFEVASDVVLSACIRVNGHLYISSSKCREAMRPLSLLGSTIHGPCSNGILAGLEYDQAFCFVSDFWPPFASSWKDRCHSWPCPNVVNDIIRNGCHFAAIGHKLGNLADHEWRISFSQAEHKLVYSMNHAQFLTYGMLKLFLNEIINNELDEEDQQLCSYHMKTGVFWAIQQNSLLHWCQENLLAGFWVCFKLLLKWVYEGVCPNFFIPQNNLFFGKVCGQPQKNLFVFLYKMYEHGINFLLQSPTIGSYIIDVLCNPRLCITTDEHSLMSEAEVDDDFFSEMFKNDTLYMSNLQDCIKFLVMVEKLVESPLTDCQVVMLQKHTASVLQKTASILPTYSDSILSNKEMYVAEKLSGRLLKLAAQFGFVSDILYIALFYYKSRRYRNASHVLELAKVKLVQPYLMYNEQVDGEMYTEAVGGQPWSIKMRKAVARDIILYNDIFYVKELEPEHQFLSHSLRDAMFVPPFIILHMLEFLCCRQTDTMKAQTALEDLQFLVHHDENEFIPIPLRDISWEILGICHQMAGNLQAARYSYQQSLRQDPLHEIQTVTRQRIQELHM
uniref:Protein mab-21 n=2 Tax=Magallana gigas TaxID=29159 RepID=A0A8W8HM90_MAGGI|nr:uncharacterized protein LOC105328813 [Crassostrea gigas]